MGMSFQVPTPCLCRSKDFYLHVDYSTGQNNITRSPTLPSRPNSLDIEIYLVLLFPVPNSLTIYQTTDSHQTKTDTI